MCRLQTCKPVAGSERDHPAAGAGSPAFTSHLRIPDPLHRRAVPQCLRTRNYGFQGNEPGLVTRTHHLRALAPCVHRRKPGKKPNGAEEEKGERWGRDSSGREVPAAQGAVPVLASSESAPEPGAGSRLIQHPSEAKQGLGGNNTPPLPWTFNSCVNLKLRELFHTESLRLEKTSEIIKSNCHPNTPMPAKPCPAGPHLHIF